MDTTECTAPPTQAIDWGDEDDGGTYHSCDEHHDDVWAYLDAFVGDAQDSAFYRDGTETCAWDSSMTPDAIAMRVANENAIDEKFELERYTEWLELGAPGGPAETVASCRAAVGDEALIALLRFARATDSYDLVPFSTL